MPLTTDPDIIDIGDPRGDRLLDVMMTLSRPTFCLLDLKITAWLAYEAAKNDISPEDALIPGSELLWLLREAIIEIGHN